MLNVTPDSFSDGGHFDRLDAALAHADEMLVGGADWIDIGGESTRPGAGGVSATEELERVGPVIRALRDRLPHVPISIDTSKAWVAGRALELGAEIVNDVTALRDPEMAATVAAHGAALVLMHMRGTPRTMQSEEIEYDDVLAQVRAHLAAAVHRAVDAGVPRERIMIDPGIGFGKRLQHNLELTRRIAELNDAHNDAPLAIWYGPSRKQFLGELTGRHVQDRDRATAAACAAAVLGGAHVVRVHDPASVRDAVTVAAAVRG